MKRVYEYIRRRLSLRLGLLIVLIITICFSLVFNFLFYQARIYIRQMAINRANQLLDNTVVRINGIMDETEAITNYMSQVTSRHLYPDSLLAFTRRTIENHEFLTGFAISMEPYYFPEMGRYFSAYTLRQNDTITTVREGPFEYFSKIWYSTPKTYGTALWVDAFDDYNEGTLSAKDILTSYCCPIRDANGRYVGSITASLTLKWLSQSVTGIRAYPHSSAIMIGRTGIYLVHPDTAKLFTQTIFSDAAPESQHDVDLLGQSMLAGRSGMTQTIVDGHKSYIFYRPLERTGWSIAIVCPESDVFSRFNQLLVMVWGIIGLGLLLLLLFCYQTVRRAVFPLRQLADVTTSMASLSPPSSLPSSPPSSLLSTLTIPPSPRRDSVGRLTNSFSSMQQSLVAAVTDISRVNAELEQRNSELARAYRMKMDDNQRKMNFVREMFHQIRTPLNIINGFTQVLASSRHELPDDELQDIITRMSQSAADISRIVRNLDDV